MNGNSVNRAIWLEDKQITVGQFQIDFKKTRLYDNNAESEAERVIKLEPLTMELLCYLVKRQGDYVSQKELLDHVWDGRIVSDNAIRRVVKKLRDALGDDVKSPTYIKTVPSKGYLLIAEVNIETVTQGNGADHTVGNIQSPDNKNIRKTIQNQAKYLFILLIVILITCYVAYAYILKPTKKEIQQIKAVTSMSGEEDWADYHKESDMVVYSHRKDVSGFFNLYIKSLSTNVTKRLSSGEANYYSAKFSKNGKKIAAQKQKGNHAELVILSLDDAMDVSKEEVIYEYDTSQPNLSWAPDDSALYFSLKKQSDYPNTIFKIDINSKRLTQVTYPDFNPYGDYFSAISGDGSRLGVLRYSNYQRTHLIILELASGKVQSNTVLDFIPQNIVWDESGSGLYLSNNNEIFFFNAQKNELTPQVQTDFGLSSIYSTCGKHCLLVGKEEENVRDIIEVKNPFFNNSINNLFEFSLAGKEGHPDYLADSNSIVFRYEYDNIPQIVTYSTSGKMELLTEFTQHHNISDLEYHPKHHSILGILDRQLFTLDINSKQIHYLTTQLENIQNPSWSNDGRSIYFSRKEGNQFWLIRQDVNSGKSEPLLSNVVSAKEDLKGQYLYYQRTDGQLYRAPLDTMKESKPIAKLELASNISWHLTSQYVYYSVSNGYKYDLVRTDLNSGKSERASLLKYAFYAKFQLHPSEQKLLLLQRAAPSTDLYNVYF
ncbi:transcriptional regulator CadC [Pseudoalteromonas sp. GCY]|uniref:winged helix-turn-helix domain-containing protein n=1 Tax=Pseudoalteromonas sp. GCY TaxID=2003316 RepID=UPI000BFF1285|nr:winged helix-turn-helix domain-containing protein [Pseudoalteromonas sp. GCY]PHI37308.1 transcriptional regulator CadC [Pseudoalteromonas sp. GCY]QQQ67229.1 winged helix-turn-helix domain-containing protein [Pseudoalteromonas sp. GCY]